LRPVHAIEVGRSQKASDRIAKGLNLIGGNHSVSDAQQNHRDTIIMWWSHSVARDTGGDVAQHPGQIAVAAKREHVRDATSKAGPSCGHQREPAAEADAHHPDSTVRSPPSVRCEPRCRTLDGVGQRRCDGELRQLGNGGRDDGDATRGELTRKGDQTRLVAAAGMQSADEQSRSADVSRRLVRPRPQRSSCRRNV